MFVLAHHYRGGNPLPIFHSPDTTGVRTHHVFRTTVWKTTRFLFQPFRPLAFGSYPSLAASGARLQRVFETFRDPAVLKSFYRSCPIFFGIVSSIRTGYQRFAQHFGLQYRHWVDKVNIHWMWKVMLNRWWERVHGRLMFTGRLRLLQMARRWEWATSEKNTIRGGSHWDSCAKTETPIQTNLRRGFVKNCGSWHWLSSTSVMHAFCWDISSCGEEDSWWCRTDVFSEIVHHQPRTQVLCVDRAQAREKRGAPKSAGPVTYAASVIWLIRHCLQDVAYRMFVVVDLM